MNTQTQKSERLLLDTKETARMLSICERSVYALAESGSLPRVMLGRSVRFDIQDIKK